MPVHPNEIPSDVKDFIFQYIDSVEQLEILLLLSADPAKGWSSQELQLALRSNLNSIEKRLAILAWYKFIEKQGGLFYFRPKDPQIIQILQGLTGVYKVQRHKIYELIFSPMKKCRDFAEAFLITKPPDSKGGSNNG